MENNVFNLIFFPEFILVSGIIIILLIALFLKKNAFSVTSNLSIILLICTGVVIFLNKNVNYLNFNDFFIRSSFVLFFQILIIIGSLSTIIISSNYFKDLKLVRFEIPILILFSSLGMIILIGSNDLMSMYLGIELQSLSLYVIAAINRDSIKSSESGIKYFILGALSSGILLYGCSLVYGFSGNTNFEKISFVLDNLDSLNLGLIFGMVFILVGLAFKVSAVPFHMWTPDVYEGAPTSVTAFFSIVPKIAGISILYRFCIEIFGNFYEDWAQIIILLSILSMFLGAIAAINQKNIKRLLAFSSIGHVGFILIGLASGIESGIKGAIIYTVIYVFMNIAIFSILLSIKINNIYVENIKDLSGLSKKYPIISICIALIMLSMAGIPPLGGFFAKFYILISALDSNLYYLAILAVIASVISAFYYLRIIKIIYFDDIQTSEITSNITLKSSLVLLLSIIFITLFVFYPSIIVNIGHQISIDYLPN